MEKDQKAENSHESPSTSVEIESQSGDIYMSGKIEIKGDVISAGEMNKTAVTPEPIPLSSGWHPAGSYWFIAALLGVALLAGGIILRFWPDENPLISTTVTILAMLLQLFTVSINQEESKHFSHTIAQYQYGKLMIIGVWIMASSCLFWNISDINAAEGEPDTNSIPIADISENGTSESRVNDTLQEPDLLATSTVQPQPDDDPLTFSIGLGYTDGLTTSLSSMLPYTRDMLYKKLNLAESLQGSSWNSPQVDAESRQNLDWWIELSIRDGANVKLSAIMFGKGGVYRQIAEEEIPHDVIKDDREDICLLDLQNRLAKQILNAMELNLADEVLTAMDEIPTVSCEALDLNNQAADILLQQDYQAAQNLLENALSLDKNYSDAYNNMGRYFYREKQWGSAAIWHIKAITLEPDNPIYHLNLGLSYERQEDYLAAVTTYKKAVADDPLFIKGWNNLGFTYLLMGEIDQAKEALDVAISLSDDIEDKMPALYKNLGRLYLAQGKPDEAVKALEEALQYIPDNETYPEALYYLAIAYQALEQFEDSCWLFFQYENSGDDEPARLEDASQQYDILGCGELFPASD